MLQPRVLGLWLVAKAHNLLRSLLAILPVHVEEQGHHRQVLPLQRSEHGSIHLVRLIEAAKGPQCPSGVDLIGVGEGPGEPEPLRPDRVHLSQAHDSDKALSTDARSSKGTG